MKKIECRVCENKFETNGNDNICANCRRKNRTRAYLYIAISILMLGFISGIVCGAVFPVQKLVYESSISISYNEYENSFNGLLMLYIWIGTALFDIFVFGINSICYRLDLLIDKKEKLNR